jgi:ATP phosphoribosyltransferase regulatory subunit HisZ
VGLLQQPGGYEQGPLFQTSESPLPGRALKVWYHVQIAMSGGNMAEFRKVYKDLGMNDTVTITMPAHMALQALTEYRQMNEQAENVTSVISLLLGELVEPVVLKAAQAQMAEQEEQHEALHNRVKSMFFGSSQDPRFQKVEEV